MKSCVGCKQLFARKKKHSDRQWEAAKYCSLECFGSARKTSQWTLTPEARNKLRLAHKGTKKPWAGKYRHSEEHNRRISASVRRIFAAHPEIIERVKKKLTGKKRTLEQRLHQSQIAKRGPQSHSWRGGITPAHKAAHHTMEWRLWREKVFTRDDYTCRKCKKRGGDLHPHHIKNFSQYISLRFITSNGITLCISCHRKFHCLYGRQNNTVQQIQEFTRAENCTAK